jgi:hypothetical protein
MANSCHDAQAHALNLVGKKPDLGRRVRPGSTG